ncbi:PGPGW domain-containing protein [Ornithinimicrobium avium]|uniref:PGPGW domain-containing protein n=1 Tax=Ornithinimicrobium avium TaxID=2283195 RepID=UPI001D1860D1|nr:PGPGW domain-containing protein [Ornithinimicrobium avium]
MTHAAKRLALETLGWTVLVLGILALFLPGPGLLLTLAGLVLLSTQYPWARRLLEPVRVRAWQAAVEGTQSWLRITLSVLAALSVAAVGVFWVASPPRPHWWPVHEALWLFGGPAVGITMILSSVLGLGLLAFSVHRFYRRPAAVAEVAAMRARYRVRVAFRRRARHRLSRMHDEHRPPSLPRRPRGARRARRS